MLYLLRKLIAAIKPKPQVFVAKGCFSPWYNSKSLIDYYVTNIDESVPCQATVTCKNVDNMNYMFGHCRDLTSLDLSNFDTSKVTNMWGMFCGCRSLTTLDLSGFDTSNVLDMSFMFDSCHSLTTLDLSNFNTSKVEYMDFMFGSCYSITTLDLSNFDTSNVGNTYSMFSDCRSLTSLDLTSFDTSKVRNMSYMFYNCTRLTTIKGVIDMKSCEYCGNMFTNCPKLRGVKIKNPPEDFDGAGLSSSQYTIVS